MKLPIVIRIPPLPQTTTILAVGFLGGCLLFTPMVALVGKQVPTDYREAVLLMAGLFKDGMLLILGYYFSKVVNAGQTEMVNKAMDAAAASTPPTATPADPPTADTET